MDVEDGHESQRHQAEALQSPGHVLRRDRREPAVTAEFQISGFCPLSG